MTSKIFVFIFIAICVNIDVKSFEELSPEDLIKQGDEYLSRQQYNKAYVLYSRAENYLFKSEGYRNQAARETGRQNRLDSEKSKSLANEDKLRHLENVASALTTSEILSPQFDINNLIASLDMCSDFKQFQKNEQLTRQECDKGLRRNR